MIVLYIELGEYRELVSIILTFLVIAIIFFSFLKYSRQNNSNDRNKDYKIPVWLLRAHVAKYYILFLKKYFSILELDFKYELKQLEFLVNNKVNVEKTIKEGSKVAHKKKLLILVFLFNISIKNGKIFEQEIKYLNEVYKDLGITYKVFNSIKSKYIKEEKNEATAFKNYFSNNKLIYAYRILGCNKDSDIKDVKEAYRTLAKKYHPDLNFNLSDNKRKDYSQKFQNITDAYNYIKEMKC